MGEELTIEDIEAAMKLIDKEPERIIYEDDYQIIEGNMMGPTKIQLKEKGVKMIKEIIGDLREKWGKQIH